MEKKSSRKKTNSKIQVFGMPCPLARFSVLLGDPWTLLLLREFFLFGPRKYQDLQEIREGISPNVLSQRIKKLLEIGILERKLYSQHPPRYQYHITKKGKELKGVLEKMRDWGRKYTENGLHVPKEVFVR